MGFTAVGDPSEIDMVFDSFDADRSGKLAYTELNKALRDGMDGASKPARRKLRTAEERAAQAILAAELPPPIDPIEPESAISIDEQVMARLRKHAVRVIDIFRQWDEDHDGLVSRKEFRKAMAVLGLEMTREDADGIFDRFDEDGSGQISYAEMKKALKKPATKKQPLAWWMNS